MASHRQDNRPAIQFYVDDWLSEPALRCCSLAARGLWMDMLCIMWKANKRGLLLTNGKIMHNKALAKMAGSEEAEVRALLDELESNEIYSKLDDGTIYNRRMYRQWNISRIRKEAGRRGGLSKTPSKNEAKTPASSPSSPSSLSKLTEDFKLTTESYSDMVLLFKKTFTGSPDKPRTETIRDMIHALIKDGYDKSHVINSMPEIAKEHGSSLWASQFDSIIRKRIMHGKPWKDIMLEENRKRQDAEAEAAQSPDCPANWPADVRSFYFRKLAAITTGDGSGEEKAKLLKTLQDETRVKIERARATAPT